MVIGFIGLGNMARALIGGILKEKAAAPEDITGSAATAETRRRMEEDFGIRTSESNAQIAAEADILFLAVKPQYLPIVLEDIRNAVTERTLIVSVAAGKTTKWLSEAFPGPVKIVRCMPNTPALVGEGCASVCRNENVTEEELGLVLRLIGSCCGMAELVPEQLMDATGGVSGSSPAFVFLFIEALADAGVKGGLPRAQSYRFAAQTVLGAARLMLESGKTPGELKDMVCSPGGTTIEGVEVLERNAFRGAVMQAVGAAIEKSKKL